MSDRIVSHTGRFWTGRAGRATEVIIDQAGNIDQSATLACWFLHCPTQSVAWDDYVMTVIHLRHIDGSTREPIVSLPHATHEVIVAALDPSKKPTHRNPSEWHFLSPINVMEQFEVGSDPQAVELLELAVRAVVEGVLWAEPPLSGQVEPWRTTVIRTSAHIRGEAHAS